MDYFFSLSKENVDLAKAEVLALYNKQHTLVDNLLIVKGKLNEKYFSRLAYTKEVFQLLFISKDSKIVDDIIKFNWNKSFVKNYSVRTVGLQKEKEFATLIWRNLNKPKVDLKNAKTRFVFIKTKNKIFALKKLFVNNEDFQSRRSHLRPKTSGTSMHPKLARAIINLTGIKKGELVDPFCGSGGVLIEAGLMNLKPFGYDIDDLSLEKSKINLCDYKIKNYKLIKKDATKLKRKINYLATDLPYARSSKVSVDLDKLFKDFFNNLNLQKKAVVIFPDFINYKKYLTNYNIEKKFNVYLHKSLSKIILLIKKL